MAVIDDLPGVVVEVVVDGEVLKEYEDCDLDDDDRTKTCYIEANTGKTFQIRIKVPKRFKFHGDALTFKIKTDVREVQGPEGSNGYMRKFTFTTLETVEDGRMFHGEASKVKDLGSLKIEVYHVLVTGRSTQTSDINMPGTRFVSEKALKGQTLSHGVELSDAVKMPEKLALYCAQVVAGVRSPFARFIFKYRSFETLKSMLIIPRTPTPPPLEEREPDSLSVQDIREMQKKLKAVKDKQASAIKIKRERTSADDNSRARKKSRPSAGDTLLQLDDRGDRFHESSTATLPAAEEREVVELD